MSNEERKKILKMFEEGKLTLEETEALLEALAAIPQEGVEDTEQEKSKREKVEKKLHRVGFDFKEELKEIRDDIDETVRETRKELSKVKSSATKENGLGGFIKGILNSFSFGFSGPGYTFEETYTGIMDPAHGEVMELNLETRNGHIRVLPGSGKNYTLQVKAVVRADNEEAAREKKDRSLQLKTDERSFVFRATDRDVMASLVLTVPRDLLYRLDLDTSNGRIEVEDLVTQEVRGDTSNGRIVYNGVKGRVLKGDTSNGRIEMMEVEAEELQADTSNGSIFMAGTARRFHCDTSNGSITIEPTFKGDGEIRTDTSNGRIRILLPEEQNCGYTINAETSLGTLKVLLPDLEITERTESHSRRSMKAHTSRREKKDYWVDIEADTSRGSIYISGKDAAEEYNENV